MENTGDQIQTINQNNHEITTKENIDSIRTSMDANERKKKWGSRLRING